MRNVRISAAPHLNAQTASLRVLSPGGQAIPLSSLWRAHRCPDAGSGRRPFEGRDIVQIKLLSDRRKEGGGIAWLSKFSPPPGKIIKIVAKALSDEHVYNLKFGRATKSGEPVRASGGYTLNPEGQPHSAFIGSESISLVIYRGEPDEIVSLEVVDIAA